MNSLNDLLSLMIACTCFRSLIRHTISFHTELFLFSPSHRLLKTCVTDESHPGLHVCFWCVVGTLHLIINANARSQLLRARLETQSHSFLGESFFMLDKYLSWAFWLLPALYVAYVIQRFRCDAATRQAKKGVRPGDIVRLIKVCPSFGAECDGIVL